MTSADQLKCVLLLLDGEEREKTARERQNIKRIRKSGNKMFICFALQLFWISYSITSFNIQIHDIKPGNLNKFIKYYLRVLILQLSSTWFHRWS